MFPIKFFSIFLVLIIMSSCSILTAPPYSTPIENSYYLQNLPGKYFASKITKDEKKFSKNTSCRTIPEENYRGKVNFFNFIKDSLNYELMLSSKYSTNGTPIDIYFTEISLSSVTKSEWKISGVFSVDSNEKNFELILPYDGFFAATKECSEANIQFNKILSKLFQDIYMHILDAHKKIK